jgi:hypothetical protein
MSSSSSSDSTFAVNFSTLNTIVNTDLAGIGNDLASTVLSDPNVQEYIPPVTLSTSSGTSGGTSGGTSETQATILPGRPDAFVYAKNLQDVFGTVASNVSGLLSYIDSFVKSTQEAVTEFSWDASSGEQTNTLDAAELESLFTNVPGMSTVANASTTSTSSTSSSS